MDSISICRLGRIDYAEALELQQRLVTARQAGQIGDICLLLEHPPVLTMGTRGHDENIYLSPAELAARGVTVHQIDRGGDVTYHGPGQIVCYPIVDLSQAEGGIRQFVSQLQQAIISMLKDSYGLEAEARSGKLTGVWIGDKKIAAIGIAVKRGVSMHGFAFNINTDLEHFSWINPCGLSMGVTSVAHELGHPVDMDDAFTRAASALAAAFARPARLISLEELKNDI